MKCVSCERTLICAECGKAVLPPDASVHRAIHEPETAIACPQCDKPLVCKWCGHAYSGDAGEFGEE